ncbi:MAG: hypothetical protein IJ250_04130, partial [Bacteroidales bacterium]|nr:hypothetical protein [Bacteroidales bacterium]
MVYDEQIEEALNRLQAQIYYDKTNLILRDQMASFMQGKTIENIIEDINKILNEKDRLEQLLQQIDINIYHKKLNKKTEIKNYISNNVYDDSYSIDKLAIFARIPIELQIISVMWIQKYGVSVEKRLTDNCYGNRLCIAEDKNSLVKGKWLYKKYIHQYHKWWNNGLQIANDTLKNNKYNINIINLDISNYYHNINFDFQILEKDIYEIDNNVDFNNIIHETLKEIHKRYWEKIKTFQLTAVKSERPLPISLPTSSLFANWFLYKLDYYIEKQYT